MIAADPYLPLLQAAELTGLTDRRLRQMIAEGEIAIKADETASANGRPQTLVRLASLPEAAQLRYWQRTLAVEEPSGEPVNLAEVPAGARAEALRRLELVLRATALLAEARRDRASLLQTSAEQAGVGRGTLYRWLAAYRAQGLPGLLPQWGAKRGRFTALSKLLQDFIRNEYLDPRRPSPTTVYRRTVELCTHLRQPAPSIATVNRFLRTLPLPAVVYAREGPKAWRAKAMPKGHRDLNALAPNDWWVADHRECDVFVRLSEEPDAPICRPWLTAWLDLGTRTCVGWQVSAGPDSETIALALRAGLLRFGVPRHLYRDNGKDFTCHYWGGKLRRLHGIRLSEEATSVLARGVVSPLGVAVHEAQPFTPWAKPIEPWFGHTFPEWEKTVPGWCGRDAKERPEKLAAELREGRLLTLDAFTRLMAERIEAYHDTEHSALGCTPRSTWAGVTIERPEPRAVDLLLMRHKPVKVYAQGIKLFGRYYWHEALELQVGHTVDVRYDRADLGRLVVFAGGTFLCEAENREALQMGLNHAALKAHLRTQREARKRVAAAVQDRGALLRPEQALAALAAQQQAGRVVAVRPAPGPEPGTQVLPRVTGFERAVAAREATRRGRPRACPVPPPSGPTTEQETLTAALLAAVPDRPMRRREADRETVVQELIQSS